MLTDKDRELIALLKINARQTVSELARKLGVSRSTVQDRINRLEASGVIAGYGVRLGAEIADGGIRAFVTISVEPRRSPGVISRLKQFAEIETLHTVAGKFDLVAEVLVQAPESLDRVLDQIGAVEGVTRTESAMILSTKLSRK